jgi:dipeptidyl aminopeptidase/acylaminoacyl peptidase
MLSREVTLTVDNLRIVGQLFLPENRVKNQYPAVCICHGIPAGVADPGDTGYSLLAKRICNQGFIVLIFNFRGTGTSEGNLDLLGWSRDLSAAIDYLYATPELDQAHLSLLGFSAGGAVSIYVASRDTRISCVVTCASPAEFNMLSNPVQVIEHFRSISVIRDKDFPSSADKWLSGFRLVSPVNHVARIAPRPLLIVHGSLDETVNITQAHKLYAAAHEPKKIVTIDGAGHRLRLDNRAINIVIDWLKSKCM